MHPNQAPLLVSAAIVIRLLKVASILSPYNNVPFEHAYESHCFAYEKAVRQWCLQLEASSAMSCASLLRFTLHQHLPTHCTQEAQHTCVFASARMELRTHCPTDLVLNPSL